MLYSHIHHKHLLILFLCQLSQHFLDIVSEEEQYEIVISFGMFWKKDAVKWLATPKVIGNATNRSYAC